MCSFWQQRFGHLAYFGFSRLPFGRKCVDRGALADNGSATAFHIGRPKFLLRPMQCALRQFRQHVQRVQFNRKLQGERKQLGPLARFSSVESIK